MYRWISEYRQDGRAAFPVKGHLKPDDAELRRLKRENEELRGGHLCKTPKMKYIFMYDFRFTFMVVTRMAKALKASTSGYYE
jgi:transposase